MSKGSCGLCGEKFNNVFDAVDHARKPGREESFNPKVILGEGAKLGLGMLFNKIYLLSNDTPIKEAVEDAYSLLYIAEMRPRAFQAIYPAFLKSLADDVDFNLSKFVYKIVTQEALKEVGLR